MKKVLSFLLLGLAVSAPPPGWPQTASLNLSDSTVALSDSQWKNAVAQFESSVSSLSLSLENNQDGAKKLQAEIRELEDKIARLRAETQNGSGVIDEFRLKTLLNDLKDKLEENSNLQHQWDDLQREFEQKALSLVALYNGRIDNDLKATDPSAQPAELNLALNELAFLIQKRNQTLALLKRYQKKTDGEAALALGPLNNIGFNDREGLQMTLDLVKDHRKNLEDQMEKWALEEDELKNELKLQGKMKEFLEDIQRMNEDSSFPHGSLKRSDLGDMAGDKERKRLQARLDDLQKMSANGQETLAQLDKIMEKVQTHLTALDTKEEK